MRKEVILAIIIGVILGAIVLYGLKIANQSVESHKQQVEVTPTPSITVTPTPTESITIDSPLDHSVSFEPSITIKGKSKPLSPVAISIEDTDEIVQSDADGYYTFEASLVGGENSITVSSPLPDGSVTSKSITVIYTSSVIE